MHQSKQQHILSDSRTALALQLGNSTKSSQENNRVKKARQFLKIIDLASKISKADELIRLLCPFCSKPVSCGDRSPSKELWRTAHWKPELLSNPSSWSNIDL